MQLVSKEEEYTPSLNQGSGHFFHGANNNDDDDDDDDNDDYDDDNMPLVYLVCLM